MSIRGENEREIPLEFRWGVSDFQFLCRESVHPSDLPVICECILNYKKNILRRCQGRSKAKAK